jgi:hypothetical protein
VRDAERRTLHERRTEGIPHLKLLPDTLLPVLGVIRERGPDRVKVAQGIRTLFPGKSDKSVLRGMVAPAGSRLHLLRISPDTISLAPNGWGVYESRLRAEEWVGIAIRAAAVERFGLPAEGVRYPSDLRTQSFGGTDSLVERTRRFIAYLKYFTVHPDSWIDAGYTTVPTREFKLKDSLRARRTLIESTLPVGALMALDDARIRILRSAWNRGVLATSFDVDRWLIADATSKRPAVQLWQQASRSIGEILIAGRSYGNLTRREN